LAIGRPRDASGSPVALPAEKAVLRRYSKNEAVLCWMQMSMHARHSQQDTSASKAVVARYGKRVQKDGTSDIDRAGLAAIVFNDPNERSWLEQLVHPIVQRRFDDALRSLPDAPIVILMIPLLFEAGLEKWCSEIWVVRCTALQQRERLMARNNCTEAEATQRIAAQWPIDIKVQRADSVINNSGRIDDLHDQLDALL
jgi:dephospho-CoA kinase